MATDEFKPLLNRSEAVRNAEPLTRRIQPLLTESVNKATEIFGRITSAGAWIGGQDEDIAPLIMYRQVIELADGVTVLLLASCADAAVPVLRAMFEASLSLDFICQTDYVRRSLSWTCTYLHSRIQAHQRSDPSTGVGAEHARILEPHINVPDYDSTQSVEGLQSMLARPSLSAVDAEYRRLKKERRRAPDWYQLFNGPVDRRALAKAVGREAEYAVFYKDWSGVSHAVDAAPYLRTGRRPGEAAFVMIRSAEQMQHRSLLAINILLGAMRRTLGHFRPDESLSDWYRLEIQQGLLELRELQIVFREVQRDGTEPDESRNAV